MRAIAVVFVLSLGLLGTRNIDAGVADGNDVAAGLRGNAQASEASGNGVDWKGAAHRVAQLGGKPDVMVRERTVVWQQFLLLDHGDLRCMTTQRSPARLLGIYDRDGRVGSIVRVRILSGPHKGCEGYVRVSSLDWAD
jgi:hypothetical protein